MEQLEYEQQTNSYASEQALATHTGNDVIHVTQAEKAAWSTGGVKLSVGYYTGDGNTSKNISLGFQPTFGLIFEADNGIARVAWPGEQLETHCGCVSRLGCSQGLSLNSDGFSVTHTPGNGIDGFSIKFNSLNKRYIYFIWQ